jgi:DNA topoisomerase-1
MTLLVVESPAKAKKIQTFFKDNKTIVKSSFGHICNLDTKKLDEMLNNGFIPIYINDPKKRDVIKTLKSIKDKKVLLAADDDREGDAIAWHTGNLFKLDYSIHNVIELNLMKYQKKLF